MFFALLILVVLTSVGAFTVLRVNDPKNLINRPRADWTECNGHPNGQLFCYQSKLAYCSGPDGSRSVYIQDPCTGKGCNPTGGTSGNAACNTDTPSCPESSGTYPCQAGKFCVEELAGSPGCYYDFCGVTQPEHTVPDGGNCLYDDECVNGNCPGEPTTACNVRKCGPENPIGGGGGGSSGSGGGTGGTGGSTGGTTTQGCNSSSPAPVWSCYQNGINGVGKGNCTWCWAQYKSGGGSGGSTHGSCFDACFQKGGGNGTACRVGCDTDSGCVESCTGNTKKYLKCVMACIVGNTGGDSCTVDSDCTTAKVCVDGACTNKTNAHLECVDSACSWALGAGSNQDNCSTVNSRCVSPIDTHLVCGTNGTCSRVSGSGTSNCLSEGSACNQVSQCWGNGGKDGKCYDGNGDGEVNILDFSCFAHFWLINISATGNPKCGVRN